MGVGKETDRREMQAKRQWANYNNYRDAALHLLAQELRPDLLATTWASALNNKGGTYRCQREIRLSDSVINFSRANARDC